MFRDLNQIAVQDILRSEYLFPVTQDSNFSTRMKFISTYGFILLHNKLLTQLANFLYGKKVADIGSGSGYLSLRLLELGVNITAIDNHSSRPDYFKTIWKHDINQDATKMDLDSYDVIILAWPEMDDTAFKIAQQIKPHQQLIFQGEGCGGCTANDNFFNYIEKFFKQEELFSDTHLSFFGIHDSWNLFTLE